MENKTTQLASRVPEHYFAPNGRPLQVNLETIRSTAPEHTYSGLDVRNYMLDADKFVKRVSLPNQNGEISDFEVWDGEDGSYLWPVRVENSFENCDL